MAGAPELTDEYMTSLLADNWMQEATAYKLADGPSLLGEVETPGDASPTRPA